MSNLGRISNFIHVRDINTYLSDNITQHTVPLHLDFGLIKTSFPIISMLTRRPRRRDKGGRQKYMLNSF